MFKSINSKFIAIAIVLIALFGLGHIALAYYYQQQSQIYLQIERANLQKGKIAILSEYFHKARFWEQVMIKQASPDAEKQFALMLHDIRKTIYSLENSVPHTNISDELEGIVGKIDSYEDMINGIVQQKVEERIFDTNLNSLFQSMTAGILQEQDSDLLRPLFSVAHFFITYMGGKQESQQRALLLVTQSLETKISSQENFDVRLIDYINKFRSALQRSYEINKRIKANSKQVDSISSDLNLHFVQFVDVIRQDVETLLKAATQTKSSIQVIIPLTIILTVVLLLIVIVLLKNHIINPMESIARTMAEVEKGDRSARFEIRGATNDEIAEVGLSLNKMLEAIEERDRTLVAYQATLERQLRELKRQKAEQEKLTQQLQRAEKMEAIGTLAGGVAHDLNNILSGIVSYPELLLLEIGESSPLRKPLLTIQESGNKAAAIVQDLLTLARRGAAIFQITNLNTIVKNYLGSPEYQKLAAGHPLVTIEARLDENLFNIKGSPIHLLKTVMNLVTNGVEAIEGVGNLTIHTENRSISQQVIGYDLAGEGDYALLVITDTGSGIAKDDLEKIFEPFFSRKRMGRSGSGLGLAVVWGTIKDHNGYVDVHSDETGGTTFTLWFPITREEIDNKLQDKSIDICRGNGESILVVDDIESQREIATSILMKLGYTALSVASGEEAVEEIQRQSVDLIILDMIMPPGMDGLDTYKKIREIHPDQKVIIASGYSESERVHEARRLGVKGYIRKPYSLEVIGNAIHAVLKG